MLVRLARISKSARSRRVSNVERAVSRAGQLIRERLRGQSPAELHLHPSRRANRGGLDTRGVPERSRKIDILLSRSDPFHVNGANARNTPPTMRIQGAFRAHKRTFLRLHPSGTGSAASPGDDIHPAHAGPRQYGARVRSWGPRADGGRWTAIDPRKEKRGETGQAVSPPASRKRAIRSAGT